jgi:antitoxin component of MazEF toxin-antitoxin module
MDIREAVMSTAAIGKWVNSLAIRIPGPIAVAAKLTDGDLVEIETMDDAIILRPAVPRLTVASLFAGKTAVERRAE